MEAVRIGIAGVGGFGSRYVREVLDQGEAHACTLIGAVDPAPEGSPYFEELNSRKIPVYASIEEFYSDKQADLMIVCSPIHYHAEQGCFAMERGSHVLCEKPVCAVIQEAYKLKEFRGKTQRMFSVGYQWAFDPPFQRLKGDVLTGKLGKPKRLVCLVFWPRDAKYYSRSWAGRLRTKEGRWVLDSVANNATAHFLHAMLHLLGDREELSVLPRFVTAELYRANPIETFDTAALKVITEDGTEVCFYASHAVQNTAGPVFRFEFENGTVYYNDPTLPSSVDTLVYTPWNGQEYCYGKPEHGSLQKVWIVVDSIRGRGSIPCSIESAMAHTLCINGAHESMPEVVNLPAESIRTSSDILWIEGLEALFWICYRTGVLPSETRTTWTRSGNRIAMDGYKEFPCMQLFHRFRP